MKIKILFAVTTLLALVFLAGCMGAGPSSAAPVATGPEISATPSATTAIQTPAAAEVQTPAPVPTSIKIAVKKVGSNYYPLVYERAGRYYYHEEGFVCTERNPQFMGIVTKLPASFENTTQVIWCEY